MELQNADLEVFMSRYVVKFTKSGYIKYTSHLDLLRLFKRTFNKTGIQLIHSQGFNPHPKMGFAQPLSLGYSSICELIEFETKENFECQYIKEKLQKAMPDGIEIISCVLFESMIKSIASEVEWAEYVVRFNIINDYPKYNLLLEDYLKQSEILVLKRKKKTKKMAEVDIRDKIKSIEICEDSKLLTLKMKLDCGSVSNLSPELVISSFITFALIDCPREEIEIERRQIGFYKNLHF